MSSGLVDFMVSFSSSKLFCFMCYFFLVLPWLFLYNNNQEEGNNANRENKEKENEKFIPSN